MRIRAFTAAAVLAAATGGAYLTQRTEARPGPVVTVHKSPSCVCCGRWIQHMRASGYQVAVVETNDLATVKSQAGVPAALGSCHTAEVGGYAVEGHVPAGDVQRLLRERPQVRGIAVAGMPTSAPGMETGQVTPYQTAFFRSDGSTGIFALH